jgi:hypothetical protein
VNELQRTAVLLQLASAMWDQKSWCGETHLQKATYLLQEMMEVPTKFDFVLYKHGPFSFDLRDEISASQAYGLMEIQQRNYPYSPSLVVTEAGQTLCRRYPRTLRTNARSISFVAERLGGKGVAELERLTTAFYVTSELESDAEVDERASLLHELKPHVEQEQARIAVEEIDTYLRDADKSA